MRRYVGFVLALVIALGVAGCSGETMSTATPDAMKKVHSDVAGRITTPPVEPDMVDEPVDVGMELSAPVVSIEELLANGYGVDEVTSWTLDIEYQMNFGYDDYEPEFTKYHFEQGEKFWHCLEKPEMAVCDGDYDRFYDIDGGIIYGTGVGGLYATKGGTVDVLFGNLMYTPVEELIENPELDMDSSYFIVEGTAPYGVVDEMTYGFFADGASESSRRVALVFDSEVGVLRGIQWSLSNGTRSFVIYVDISKVNDTVVELPFDPDTVRRTF